MKRTITVTLTALMLVAFAATGEAKRRTPRRHPSNDWKVTIATSGGFTGRGNGSVTVSWDGRVAVTPPSIPNRPQPPCTTKLSDADLATIREAVERANAPSWRGKTFGRPVPDAMSYSLTLSRGGTTSTASWFDASRESVPAALVALIDAINPAWQKARESCAPPAQ